MITTITQGIHNSILEAPYREVHYKKIGIWISMQLLQQWHHHLNYPKNFPIMKLHYNIPASKGTHAVCLNPIPQ